MSAASQVDWFTQNAPKPQTQPQAQPQEDWFAQNASKAAAAPERTAMDSVRDFSSEVWKQINPVTAIQGLKEATAHPIQTFKNDADARQAVYDKAEQHFKNGDYAGGAAHLLYSVLPLVGPQLSEAGSNFEQGNTAKGAGQSVGMGINLAAPAALKDVRVPIPAKAANAATEEAADLYKSALKPSLAPKNLAKSEAAVQTGLREGIPVSKGGVEKLGDLIEDVNQKMDAAIPKGSPNTVNKFAVATRLNDTYQKFATQATPTSDLNAIAESGNDFLASHPAAIPVEDAAKIKTGTYQTLKGKYGQVGSASEEAQKALARGIKEELIQQFPELQDLGIRDQQFLNLEPVLQKAVARIGNHQKIGIGTPLVAAGAGAVTGSKSVAAVLATLKAVVDNPVVKSRLAIALNRAGMAKGITLPLAKARINSYINALGQPVAEESGQAQPAFATP